MSIWCLTDIETLVSNQALELKDWGEFLGNWNISSFKRDNTEDNKLIANYLLQFSFGRHRKLIVTSDNDCPEECQNGVRKIREDMRKSHEEADVIIPQQISSAIASGYNNFKVISEDTDIFVLLCHFYHEKCWTAQIYMEVFISDNVITCIKSSVDQHQDIICSLLSVHAFECDTVPSFFSVGKKLS